MDRDTPNYPDSGPPWLSLHYQLVSKYSLSACRDTMLVVGLV